MTTCTSHTVASNILNLHVNAALACNISIVYKQADLQMQPNDENLSIETAQYTLLVCNWITQCNLIFFRVTYLNFINKSALD